MAYYLVTAKPRENRLDRLNEELRNKAFLSMKPFGKALTYSLEHARIKKDGYAIWEEEDYCSPPLKEERQAVLDQYFKDIRTEQVGQGEGWNRISNIPALFPSLAKNQHQ